MKNWILLFGLIISTAVIVSCGKKEEAAAPSPGCPIDHVSAPAFGRCVPRGQCPRGLVVNPNQLSMCADMNTGDSVMPQQCGAGYFLTAFGCFQQGLCPAGQAQYSDTCKAVVGGSGNYMPQQQYGNMNMYGGGGMPGMMPGMGAMPYGYNPYQFR